MMSFKESEIASFIHFKMIKLGVSAKIYLHVRFLCGEVIKVPAI